MEHVPSDTRSETAEWPRCARGESARLRLRRGASAGAVVVLVAAAAIAGCGGPDASNDARAAASSPSTLPTPLPVPVPGVLPVPVPGPIAFVIPPPATSSPGPIPGAVPGPSAPPPLPQPLPALPVAPGPLPPPQGPLRPPPGPLPPPSVVMPAPSVPTVASAGTPLVAAEVADTTVVPCSIGQLTGRWRIRYLETSGTCGPLADAVVGDPATPPDPQPCQATERIAADRCAEDFSSSCTHDSGGEAAAWILGGRLEQESDTVLGGNASLTVTGSRACSSTYAMTVTAEP